MPLPHGAIFDMDGLLLDSEPVHAAAYVTAFREAGFSLTLERYRQYITLGGGMIHELYLAQGGAPEGWNDIFTRKCALYQQAVTTEMQLLPGVTTLLAALAQRGTPCVLATGARRFNAEVVLSHFQLEDYFQAVIAGEDVHRVKPDPEVFHKATARLALSPEACVSFEDSPKGVRAAVAAGVACVAAPTDWTRSGDFTGAIRVVDSLVQVTPSLLEELFHNKEGK